MKNNCNSFSDCKQISFIRANGKFLKNGIFSFNYVKTPKPEDGIRYALSVSKKNFKLAVTRNKIKRHLRFFLANNCKNATYDSAYCVMISVSKNYLNNTYEKNSVLFDELFKKMLV
jgi:ribonuclease P protein component